MQPPAYKEIIRRLLKEGFCERASKGDHRRFCKGAMRVTVRDQGNKHPTWREWSSIKKQAGWSKGE